MSVRLLREASDSPNITNRDDTRMIRYAYGGLDGVLKDFENELSYEATNSKFTIHNGRIVLQGWEVDVEGSGWELDLSTVSETQYHLVYLEVNAAMDTAEIKSSYLTGTVPQLDLGDDLTKYPEGTARLPLYSFRISNSVFSQISKKFTVIDYYGKRLSSAESSISTLKSNMTTAQSDIRSLESRLSSLGFKEGTVTLASRLGGTVTINYLKRQGNYVIGRVEYFGGDYYPDYDELESTGRILIGRVPKEFAPLENTLFYINAKYYTYRPVSPPAIFTDWACSIDTNGSVYLLYGGSGMSLFAITGLRMFFGYEAKPL